MDDSPQGPGGLLTTGKRILRSICDLAQTRLELFLTELKEERFRLFDALLLMVMGVGCALMMLVLLTFTLVLLFWDHRVIVLIVLTLLYGFGAGAAFWTLRQRLRSWDAFAATLEELKKDRACLDKQS
jgi:uncharacterized membrane protein YqjE